MKNVFFVLMVMVGLSIATPYSFAERGRNLNGILKHGGIGDFNENISIQEFQNRVSHKKKDSTPKKRTSQGVRNSDVFFNILSRDNNGHISTEEFNNRKHREHRRD